ncbi:aspartate racemase [Novosphingobium kunmingense]|uniref:Aspartate racemase n=1 Tax=Novosphingobium kunmingense TaxID=1211806 RepID=A0A2N0HKI5_9SPHN|nr:aspartate/glutamate racemase family protein [Novosphingobium kunmingense]PKB19452.1 aspartate racemase [Novosphingobium kunmingense]
MKTIGLIGGISWKSTAEYYRVLNQLVLERLGGVHSARIVLVSVDFDEIATLQHAGEWDRLGEIMAEAARSLHAAGADFILICANTMHLCLDAVEAATPLPVLHIADPTAKAMARHGMSRAGLLGTGFTMDRPFLADRILAVAGIDCFAPGNDGRADIHRIIFEELVAGRIEPASQARFRGLIEELAADGAQGVILGCTELVLLVEQGVRYPVPLFDTTALHAAAAVEWALA